MEQRVVSGHWIRLVFIYGVFSDSLNHLADGTKGFLRGEQYAVCLALIENGDVKLGVMGCPNLPVSLRDPDAKRGSIVYAVQGHGAYQVGLSFTFSAI